MRLDKKKDTNVLFPSGNISLSSLAGNVDAQRDFDEYPVHLQKRSFYWVTYVDIYMNLNHTPLEYN